MILAAGKGSRMGSLSLHTPKPLTLLAGKTLIEYHLIRFKNAGITEIYINVSHLGNKIKSYLGEGKKYGVNITYLDESNLMLGTGGGIANALPLLGNDQFWLINADVFTDFEIPLDLVLNPNFLGHLFLVPNPEHNSKGDFYLSNNKISYSENNRPLTFSGISLLSPNLFDGVDEKIFPLEPILDIAAINQSLSGEIYEGYWSDIGSQDRLKQTEEYLKTDLF
jgi:N-acetyl-alpha-D-muramate 1-phosphate uridylyltransferase